MKLLRSLHPPSDRPLISTQIQAPSVPHQKCLHESTILSLVSYPPPPLSLSTLALFCGTLLHVPNHINPHSNRGIRFSEGRRQVQDIDESVETGVRRMGEGQAAGGGGVGGYTVRVVDG